MIERAALHTQPPTYFVIFCHILSYFVIFCHIFLIPSQPVYTLTSSTCVLSGKAADTIVPPWFDPTGARTYEQAYQYITDVVEMY